MQTRREFIGTASACAGAALAKGAVGSDKESMLIIDCHAHIYGTDEEKYPTIEDPYRPPKGTGTVAHLHSVMKEAGVRNVTAIQTSTYYRWDNRFTTDSSRANTWMAGVCTLDPDNPASPELLEKYVAEYGVRGMRSIPAKSGNLDGPGVDKLWGTAERLGIVINALINRGKKPELITLAKRHPNLSVVVDHCLNLKAGPELQATLKDMLNLAEVPNLHAKLTFIPTGSAEPYPCQDMHDACRAIIDRFGPERCVWGSDFPCELWCPKITYAQHLRIFTHELGLDANTQAAVLGQTAQQLWF
jgi:L-fuconolactonase